MKPLAQLGVLGMAGARGIWPLRPAGFPHRAGARGDREGLRCTAMAVLGEVGAQTLIIFDPRPPMRSSSASAVGAQWRAPARDLHDRTLDAGTDAANYKANVDHVGTNCD